MQADGAIAAVVDKFYNRIMADEKLTPFFSGVDMDKQRQKQTAFVTMAFGDRPLPYRRCSCHHPRSRLSAARPPPPTRFKCRQAQVVPCATQAAA